MKKNMNFIKVIIGAIALMLLTQFVYFNNEAISKSILFKEEVTEDIVSIAIKDGRFKILATTLTQVGLVDKISNEGPFTIFAPTDEAFSKIPKDKLDELLKPENKGALVSILTLHVMPGKVTYDDLVKMDGKEIIMVNGMRAKVMIKDNKVYINDAKVDSKDINASNGIIHVMDNVIMPKGN
ncbi:MAG: fasciclin domain-containing protein [Clostridium sp.]